MTTPPPQPRGPLFWILVIGGVVMTGCCVMTGLLMTLGAFANEPEAVSAGTGGTANTGATGDDFLLLGEVARGTRLTISLPGGRWIDQFGSRVESVVGRSGSYAWVQTNASGALHELTFDDDTYEWHWASQMTLNGMKSASHCEESGAYELSGTQLSVKPESQRCVYSTSGLKEERNDEDLSARSYEVLDLTLETIDEPKRQVPGVFMSGPRPKWDTGSGSVLTLKLQRLNPE